MLMICQVTSLGMLCLIYIFDNLFPKINICLKIGNSMLNEDDLFIPPTLNDQICYDDCMPPIYDDCNIYGSEFGRVSTLDNNCPTILEGAESYYNDKSGFV